MAKLREPDRLPVEALECKERIADASASYPGGQCLGCEGREFQKHAKRWRWFLPVILGFVYPIRSVLWRWRCARCGRTMTHYPTECLPGKRYLRPEIEGRAGRYVQEAQSGYRKVVENGACAVAYEQGPLPEAESSTEEKQREQIRYLAASTVHRWIDRLAAGGRVGQAVAQPAKENGERFSFSPPPIPVWKYRRPVRRKLLETCRRLLLALSWRVAKTPTGFATLGSSP